MIFPIIAGFFASFLTTSVINVVLGMAQFSGLVITIFSSVLAAIAGYYVCLRLSAHSIHRRMVVVYGLAHGMIANVHWYVRNWNEWGTIAGLQTELIFAVVVSVCYLVAVLIIGAVVRYVLFNQGETQ